MYENEPWKSPPSESHPGSAGEGNRDSDLSASLRTLEAQHSIFVFAVDAYARFERRDKVITVTRTLLTGGLAVLAIVSLLKVADPARWEGVSVVVAFVSLHWLTEWRLSLRQRQYLLWMRERRDAEPQPVGVVGFHNTQP